MTDYKRTTGSGGQMMIRDNGSTVEWWITANNGTTYNHALPWRFHGNGTTSTWRSYDYKAGAYWERLGWITVTTSQEVWFEIGDTGTSGLGGPTRLTVDINRGSAPPKPPPWVIEEIKSDRVQGDVDGAGNGGLTIDMYQVAWSLSSDVTTAIGQVDDNDDGWQWVTGLTKGTRYYFWNRTHNAKGWSPWSDRTTAVTDSEPAAPSKPVITGTTLTSASLQVTWGSPNGDAIIETQLGYGPSSTAPTLYQMFPTLSKTITVPGLDAGRTYYFWARTRNDVGWSPWSPRADNSGNIVPGAWYFIDDGFGNIVPRRAMVYVKVGGVWRVAIPMIKIAGMWKGTA